jgi:hypothetical protein
MGHDSGHPAKIKSPESQYVEGRRWHDETADELTLQGGKERGRSVNESQEGAVKFRIDKS